MSSVTNHNVRFEWNGTQDYGPKKQWRRSSRQNCTLVIHLFYNSLVCIPYKFINNILAMDWYILKRMYRKLSHSNRTGSEYAVNKRDVSAQRNKVNRMISSV